VLVRGAEGCFGVVLPMEVGARASKTEDNGFRQKDEAVRAECMMALGLQISTGVGGGGSHTARMEHGQPEGAVEMVPASHNSAFQPTTHWHSPLISDNYANNM
jgi:hypothetical protein